MPFVHVMFTILLLISLGLLGVPSRFAELQDLPAVSAFDAGAPSPVSGFDGMR